MLISRCDYFRGLSMAEIPVGEGNQSRYTLLIASVSLPEFRDQFSFLQPRTDREIQGDGDAARQPGGVHVPGPDDNQPEEIPGVADEAVEGR